jgi:hypothetical protein
LHVAVTVGVHVQLAVPLDVGVKVGVITTDVEKTVGV